MQTAGRVNLPGPREGVCVGKANIQTLVVGEVEVIATERILHPIRNAYERRTLNVLTDAGVDSLLDYRTINKARDLDRVPWSLLGARRCRECRPCHEYHRDHGPDSAPYNCPHDSSSLTDSGVH